MNHLNFHEAKTILRHFDKPTYGNRIVLIDRLEKLSVETGKNISELIGMSLRSGKVFECESREMTGDSEGFASAGGARTSGSAVGAQGSCSAGVHVPGSSGGVQGSNFAGDAQCSGVAGMRAAAENEPVDARDILISEEDADGRANLGKVAKLMRYVVDDDVEPGDSASRVSRLSRTSSTRSSSSAVERQKLLRAQLVAARKAEEVEKRLEQKRERLKEKMMEQEILKREQESLEAEVREIERKGKTEVLIAEIEALDGEEDCKEPFSLDHRMGQVTGKKQKASADLPKREVGECVYGGATGQGGATGDLIKTFMQCSLLSQLPRQEIEKFSGGASSYCIFRRAFKTQIEQKLGTDYEKLHYLHQYTMGRPQSLVKACLNMDSSVGYDAAWRMLDKKYGNAEKIGSEYVNGLLGREVLTRDNASGLEDYHIELLMTKHAVSNVPYGRSELENPRTLKILVEKLPFSLQEKWRYRAVKLWEEHGRSAGYDDLLEIIERAASAANHPLYGRQEGGSRSRTKESYVRDNKRVTCGAVSEVRCWECGKSHDVRDCNVFRKLSHGSKLQVLRKYEACYRCLRPGHMARSCVDKNKCEECQGWHHTLLHRFDNIRADRGNGHRRLQSGDGLRAEAQAFEPNDYAQAQVTTTSVLTTNGEGGAGRMTAVPVFVTAGQKQAIRTAAFLDSGSAVSFCTQSLVAQLGMMNEVKRTNLRISTMTGERDLNCGLVSGLFARGISGQNDVALPPLYVIGSLPVTINDIITTTDIGDSSKLKDLVLPEIGRNVDLMLGSNAVASMEPLEIIPADQPGGQYAMRTRLGWVLCGSTTRAQRKLNVGRISVRDEQLNRLVERAFDGCVEDLKEIGLGESEEDKEWLEIVESSCTMAGGKYTISLPVRKVRNKLPNSKRLAFKRVIGLRTKLLKDAKLKEEYIAFMTRMKTEGYMEKASEAAGEEWYIPHFGVKHQSKPDKVRVVFDCAAKVDGVALNDILLQGPDLNSKLLDVLLRFRKGSWAFMGDIDAMFYQVQVPPKDRDYLRFFWWNSDDLEGPPTVFRMTVHLFGACSSPSVATYALRKTTLDNVGFDHNVCETILKNFYVDDCLKSSNNEENLTSICSKVGELCNRGGFNLSKFSSNSSVLRKKRSLETESERKALGVCWNLTTDKLVLSFGGDSVPYTRRQLLSFVAGIYDPLGIASPLCLTGRCIIQVSFRNEMSWDEKFTGEMKRDVEKWIERLRGVMAVDVSRNILGEGKSELHIFSDASNIGHGAVAYIKTGFVVKFIWGKARVNPLKDISVPRLELMAATLAARMGQRLVEVLEVEWDSVFMRTDSMTVLRYIRNKRDRYETFVANRVTLIRARSEVGEWRYVDSASNPADDASRGLQSSRWLQGPSFLLTEDWPTEPREIIECVEDEQSVLQVAVTMELGMDRLLAQFSSWDKLKRTLAWWKRFKCWLSLKRKSRGGLVEKGPHRYEELSALSRMWNRFQKGDCKCIMTIYLLGF